MAAAVSHSNKTVAFNEPVCSLFIIFQYYSDSLSNFICIFNSLNKLFADHRHPFVNNIHCIGASLKEVNVLLAPVSFTFNSEVK